MTSLEVIELIERFQTVLVGAVGFLGVIWTLRSNARHAREDHKRQVDTRRMTLRRILAAEFRNYSHALKKNFEAPPPNDELFSLGKVRRVLAKELATDLGLLELGEVDVVVNAIISLDGMEHYLENLSTHDFEKRFLIPIVAWDEFRMVASTTAEALDIAVEALELSGEA